MVFHPVTVDIVKEISGFFKYQDYRICEHTPGCIWMWQGYFFYEYAIAHDMVCIKSKLPDGTFAFVLPVGPGSVKKAIEEIIEYCCSKSVPFIFQAVTEAGLNVLHQNINGKFNLESSDDWSDYLYNKDDLTGLKGKKYDGKRNHISRFIRTYGEYAYQNIDKDNISRVADFYEAYTAKVEGCGDIFVYEKNMVREVLKNCCFLGLTGGFIEVQGNIAAFSIGEKVGDTLYVHIEKADRDFMGSYAVINKEFAIHNTDDSILYINREEDLGDEGLRKAKMSYHPVEAIKKYKVTITDIC